MFPAMSASERARDELYAIRRGLTQSKRLKTRLRRNPGEAPHGADAALRVVVSRCLAGGLELYGVYGPSVAARDLASFGRACRGFVPIARDGFQELSAEVARQEDAAGETTRQLLLHAQQHVEQQEELWEAQMEANQPRALLLEPPEPDTALRLPAGLEWGFWDALLADPAGLKAADLKRGAAALGLEVRGTKAQLALDVLDGLGVAALPAPPARLLRALRLERGANLLDPAVRKGALEPFCALFERCVAATRLGPSDLPHVNGNLYRPGAVSLGLRAARRELARHGVLSSRAMLALTEDAERRGLITAYCRSLVQAACSIWADRMERIEQFGLCMECGAEPCDDLVDDLCEDCAAKAMMEEEGYSEFDSSLDYDDSDMFGSEFGGEDWDG